MQHHRLSMIAACQLLEQIGVDHYVSLQVPTTLASLLESRLNTLCILLKKLVECPNSHRPTADETDTSVVPSDASGPDDDAFDETSCSWQPHPSIAALVYLMVGRPSSHAFPELSYYLKGQKLWLASIMSKIVEPGTSLPHESLVTLFSTSPSAVALTGKRPVAKGAEKREDESPEASYRTRMKLGGFDDLLPYLPPLPWIASARMSSPMAVASPAVSLAPPPVPSPSSK